MLLTVLLLCVAFLLGLSVTAAFAGRHSAASAFVYTIALVICAAGLEAGLSHLLANKPAVSVVLPLGLPWMGAHFSLDALSAFFLVIVNMGGAVASLYALGYGRHEHAPHRILPFYPAFLAGMNMVVMSADAFTFLLSWEFMSLSSWALVMAHHRVADNARAGYIYIVMATFGTLALLLAFGLMAGPDGNFAFADIRNGAVPAGRAMMVLALVLLGAGSKAGLVPLHVWLPLAHPAAPSHVSALMSGVMTKVAIYGFIRIVFDLLDAGTGAAGSMIVLVLGSCTAVAGILYAMMQRDLKRLLAYSTVENVGVIFVGLGLALAFKSYNMNEIAALALTAALFHAFNHTAFKSLLFFGAGSVLSATGERDIEKAGGLIHRMPATALLMLIGCAAISALPPLSGFASEWLMFQSILHGPVLGHWGLKVLVPAAGGMLALAAALAAATFVKVFGVAFLGRPRTPEAANAHETDRFSLTAMGLFAGLCVVAGVLPGYAIDALSPVVQMLAGDRIPVQAGQGWATIVPIAEGRSSYNGLIVFAFIAFSAFVVSRLIHALASSRVRRSPAWDCGFPVPTPVTQYTGSSFSQPIRRVFGYYLFHAREHVDMAPPGSLRASKLRVELRDLIWERIFSPVSRSVLYVSDKMNYFQFLTIRHYLSLVFSFLVLLLLVLALWF